MSEDRERMMIMKINRLKEMMKQNRISESSSRDNHYQHNYNKERAAPRKSHSLGTAYSTREDDKLLKAVKEHNYKWAFISQKYFNGTRSGDSLRNRYNILENKKKTRRPSTPHPRITQTRSAPIIRKQTKPLTKSVSSISRPTVRNNIRSSTTNGQTPYSKNGRKVYVMKTNENGNKQQYRVYQGARGGFLFKRAGRDVKLNHTNGFIYKK